MDKENLDKKNFVDLVSQSQILKNEERSQRKMPDFTALINRDNSTKDEHKRYRNQKSIIYLILAFMFQNRPQTFNGSYEDINHRKSLKEGVQNFIKGKLNEDEFRNILKKNNVNPENLEINKQMRSTSLNGSQGNNLMTTVLKYKPEK